MNRNLNRLSNLIIYNHLGSALEYLSLRGWCSFKDRLGFLSGFELPDFRTRGVSLKLPRRNRIKLGFCNRRIAQLRF